jgi:hypothetical protein
MSFLAASIASSSSATSSSNQSLVFNPVITVGSPEAQIRQDSRADQRSTFSADTSSTARATSTVSPTGSGNEGYTPGATLGPTAPSQGSGPSFLAGDLIPTGAGGFASSPEGLALMAGLAVAAYFVAKRFF